MHTYFPSIVKAGQSALFAGLVLLGQAGQTAHAAVLAIDDFEQASYGAVVTDIYTKNGGDGWSGAWGGSAGISFTPNNNWTYTATGYIQTGLSAGIGGGGSIFRDVSGQGLVTRSFTSAPITEGTLWVSFLSNRLSVNSLSDRTGLTFTTDADSPSFYVGTRGGDFGIGSGTGFIDLGSTSGNTGGTTHLILMRLDIATHSISAWFDPTDVSSIAALGTPDVFNDSREFSAINPSLVLVLQEDTNFRMSLDALRVAYGSSEQAFQLVTTAVPEPSSIALLLLGAGGVCAGMRARKRS